MSKAANQDAAAGTPSGRLDGAGIRIAVSWLLVGVPLAYGVFQTVSKASALFG